MPAANYTVSASFTAIDRYSARMVAMGRATSRFSRRVGTTLARADMAFRRLGRRISGITKKFGALGMMVGAGLLIGGLTSSIDKFASFEQANANLASVMSSATRPELEALQKDAMRLGATTAKSATQVVGLQESMGRLGFSSGQVIDMTESIISGSIAMKSELADTADLTGAVINTFDKFSSVDASQIMDQMVTATQKSALSFEKLNTSLPIVAGAANAAGVPFNKLLALLGKLSDSGIDASSSANSLKNILIESASQGLTYDKILDKIVANQDQLTAANDEFGKRASISGVILAKNIKLTDELARSLNVEGAANAAANKQLNTLKGRLTILGSAWEGFIINLENGNGEFGKFLKITIEVATEILSLASGTAKAKNELNENELIVRKWANRGIFFVKVIGWVIAAFVALKIAIVANNAIMAAGKFIRFVGIFIKIARAKGIWTAAQWALNIAMSANPIGLIIIAIVLFIAYITVVIKKYDEWGAAVALISGPIGWVINLVQSFREKWDLLKASFKGGGILQGIKTIGKTIFDAILMPLQQVIELIARFTKWDAATQAAEDLSKYRGSLFTVENRMLQQQSEGQKISTTKTAAAQESLMREERIEKKQAELLIKKESGVETEIDMPLGFPVKLSPTF